MNAVCAVCREARADHMHHKLRRSQGGTNDPSNLVPVCFACHERIHRNPSWARAYGWLETKSYCRKCGLVAGHWKGCEG